jgi:hypothetical protein
MKNIEPSEETLASRKRRRRRINLRRYQRQYARRAKPPAQPNRAARRAHMIKPQQNFKHEAPAVPFLPLFSKGKFFDFQHLLDFFKLPLGPPPPPKQKHFYEEFHDAQGRKLLREVRNIDRRPLKEIRRTRREQTLRPEKEST